MTRVDIRHLLGEGDRTSTGGYLVATSDSTNMGKRLGVEGDYATCPACKSGGPVYNDCDPRWTEMGKSVLVEGARVYCKCAVKPRVIASQFTMSTEVTSGGGAGENTASISENSQAHNKLVSKTSGKPGPDAASLDAYEADPAMICPNMTNAEFLSTVMRVRDIAVAHMDARLIELERWNESDQEHVRMWFADATPDIRKRLREGIQRIRQLSLGLTERNFCRFSEEAMRKVGCIPAAKEGDEPAWASVCKADKTFTIFIGVTYCYLPIEAMRYTGVVIPTDSMVTVFIHEVSHFPAAMDSMDDYSSIKLSRLLAKRRHKFLVNNADSIASYISNVSD